MKNCKTKRRVECNVRTREHNRLCCQISFVKTYRHSNSLLVKVRHFTDPIGPDSALKVADDTFAPPSRFASMISGDLDGFSLVIERHSFHLHASRFHGVHLRGNILGRLVRSDLSAHLDVAFSKRGVVSKSVGTRVEIVRGAKQHFAVFSPRGLLEVQPRKLQLWKRRYTIPILK